MPTATDWTPLLQRAQLHVAASWRMELNVQMWQLDLLSPFWRVYINDRPGASLICAGEQIELLPDCLYVIPAWVRFQTSTTRPVTQDFIHFYLTGFPPPVLRQLFDRPLALPLTAPLDALAQQWRGTLTRGNEGAASLASFAWSYALTHAALAQYVTHIVEAMPGLGGDWLRDSTLVWPALQHIESHLASPSANPQLAALCHLSTDHFIRHFRRAVGSTPTQYGLERRVALAAHQLINSQLTIEEIAAASGFNDRFHFSKVFKQRLHMPPVAYRKMHREGS